MSVAFEEHDTDIARRCDNEEVVQLLSIWTDAALKSSSGLPKFEQINLKTLARFAPNLMIVDPLADGDFQYLYYGDQISASAGIDMTGRRVSDFTGAVGTYFASRYRDVLANGKPLFTIHKAQVHMPVLSWERLILPVQRSEDTKVLFVFNKPREFKHALLHTLLDTSADAILAVNFKRDEAGRIVDAVIHTSNSRAQELFAGPDEDLAARTLSEIMPAIRSSGVWERLLSATFEKERAVFVEECNWGETSGTYRISAAPMNNGLAITWTDVTEFAAANQKLTEQAIELIEANEVLERQAADLVGLADDMERSRSALNKEIKRREALERRLRQVADTDHLTGIANRRSFLATAEIELARARETDKALTFIMADIDHFKRINDTYGHAAGDRALIQFSEYVATSLRVEQDFVARIGGEEFAFILPCCDTDSGGFLADRLRAGISELHIPLENDGAIQMTASFGVASLETNEDTVDKILARADAALYDAKSGGRNRVIARRPKSFPQGREVDGTQLKAAG